jgi:hypothetical protein
MSDTTLERVGGGDNPTCDIVFVHGLDGGPHKTWQHDRSEIGDYWPSWVAEAHPEAAVWTVGYEAATSAWFGNDMPIMRRAKTILARLAPNDIGQRPLAFVTHSMGGIIVKQMLRLAEANKHKRYHDFAENTKLLVFVAVPHQGSRLADYLEALRVVFRPADSARDLRANSLWLCDLNEWFRIFVESRQLEVVSFHEEAKTRGVWVVPHESADFGFPGHLSIGETLDHIQISKPLNRDSLIAAHAAMALRHLVVNLPRHADLLPRLSYICTAEIDPRCIPILLSGSEQAQIAYFDDISRAVETLKQRDRRPEDFLLQLPYFHSTTKIEERESFAARLHSRNDELLRQAMDVVDRNNEALRLFLKRLKELKVSDDLAGKSLRTFAAIAALQMIQILKGGYDWVAANPKPQSWFESFKINSQPFYCLLDRVPLTSDTGRQVFGYRYWVAARVGHEDHYEKVMFPLKVVLPLFLNDVKGNAEAFYTWVLPQLFLVSSSSPVSDLPVGDWKAFLLRDSNGTEWWNRHEPSPWPDISGSIDALEL